MSKVVAITREDKITRETRMRPLRYSINVTLDGCCDHRAIPPDEELQDLHRHAVENFERADALLFGRVTYELMEAVQALKLQSGKGLFVGGVTLPMALAELGLIDEYEFVVQPRLVGHGPTLFAGLTKRIDLKLVERLEFGSGAVAMRYEPKR
jgi:riboflavin biosynthesis pyrimidine reductase